jgi:hypothetical protein
MFRLYDHLQAEDKNVGNYTTDNESVADKLMNK